MSFNYLVQHHRRLVLERSHGARNELAVHAGVDLVVLELGVDDGRRVGVDGGRGPQQRAQVQPLGLVVQVLFGDQQALGLAHHVVEVLVAEGGHVLPDLNAV